MANMMEEYQIEKTYQAFSKSKGRIIHVQKIKIERPKRAASGPEYSWYEVFINQKNNIVTLGDPVSADDIRIISAP
jgi:hypothetical protein